MALTCDEITNHVQRDIASEMEAMRRRAWQALADKDIEIARVKAKNLELYKKISELATDAYELTVRAEAAEDKLKALTPEVVPGHR
jgi:predicted short-subunit dehydrogenase-like oxidoreductase (DUF2520 family)